MPDASTTSDSGWQLDSTTLQCDIYPMTDPTNRPIADLIADLAISEAEVEAGDIVPGEVVFAELEARLARLKAKQRLPVEPRTISRR
jgi:hypothetical protein